MANTQIANYYKSTNFVTKLPGVRVSAKDRKEIIDYWKIYFYRKNNR